MNPELDSFTWLPAYTLMSCGFPPWAGMLGIACSAPNQDPPPYSLTPAHPIAGPHSRWCRRHPSHPPSSSPTPRPLMLVPAGTVACASSTQPTAACCPPPTTRCSPPSAHRPPPSYPPQRTTVELCYRARRYPVSPMSAPPSRVHIPHRCVLVYACSHHPPYHCAVPLCPARPTVLRLASSLSLDTQVAMPSSQSCACCSL
jgi:hypothetical protein